jgi:hypothetical protein
MRPKQGWTRREALKLGAVPLAGSLLGGGGDLFAAAKSKVVVIGAGISWLAARAGWWTSTATAAPAK